MSPASYIKRKHLSWAQYYFHERLEDQIIGRRSSTVQGNYSTGKLFHRETTPQGNYSTGKLLHREYIPQGIYSEDKKYTPFVTQLN